MRKIERNAGDRHVRLVLVKEVQPDKWGGRQFLFQCDCGKKVTVRWGITASLLVFTTRSYKEHNKLQKTTGLRCCVL